MSRRRRRVKIKSSSRLFAFILFNLLLLGYASWIAAHYLGNQHLSEHVQSSEIGGYLQPAPVNNNKYAEQSFDLPTLVGAASQQQHQQQHQQQSKSGEVSTASPKNFNNQHQSSQTTSFNTLNLEQQLQPAEVDYLQQGQQHLQLHNNNNNNNFHPQQQQHLSTQNMRLREQSMAGQNNQQQVASSQMPSVQSLCSMLPAISARHMKLCKLTSQSLQADEAVALGASRGLAECRNQFRNEQWNCTHAAGEHHLLTSRFVQSLGNREGAFVQAIAAAGIVHSIATACSVGSLSDCACDKTRVGIIRQRDHTWKWGGCSNNIRHGMMFARHLVELLDAVHEQQQLQHHHQMQRSLSSSSSSSSNNHFQGQSSSSYITANRQHKSHRFTHQRHHHHHHHHHHQQQQDHHHLLSKRQIHTAADLGLQSSNYNLSQQICQKNQNISQITHLQLIKSLLAKNSLERHQDFRLAMNMHNNKVGRMAVAKNMDIVCRCHGLSGSCSLKTCWLKLPDFQQVGAYLRRKYEVSVHLSRAVNVNKLIPMMDRQELSTILQLQAGGVGADGTSGFLQEQQGEPAGVGNLATSGQTTTTTTTTSGGNPTSETSLENSLATAVSSSGTGQLEYSALTRVLEDPASHTPSRTNITTSDIEQLAHFGYYERHRQLEQRQNGATFSQRQPPTNGGPNNSTMLYLHDDTEPIQVSPMSQQQYQSLLRDTRLCANTSLSSQVSMRDLNNGLETTGLRQLPVAGKRKSSPTSNYIHLLDQKGPLPTLTPMPVASIGLSANQQLKFTSAHLSQLLQVQAAREDLIHLHRSPDYCKADPRHGLASVTGRVCSESKEAANSCDKLCCSRGFVRRETQLKTACKCEFYFCCKIQCKMCEEKRVEFVCK